MLDADPELGRLLDDRAFAAARLSLFVTLRQLPRGPWMPREGNAGSAPTLGLLLTQGFLTRTIWAGGRRGVELMGPGDVFLPGAPGGDRCHEDWHVLEPATVAVLDREFLQSVTVVPEIVAELTSRAVQRAARLTTLMAFSEIQGMAPRMRELLWHLADQWGRVVPGGTAFDLRISHAMLGALVGACRTSTTTGVNELIRERALARPSRRRWLLIGERASLKDETLATVAENTTLPLSVVNGRSVAGTTVLSK